MIKRLKTSFNISFAANPFYMYCAAFTSAVFTYSWGWSDIYPRLSYSLIVFLVLSFVIFIIAGRFFIKTKCQVTEHPPQSSTLNDLIFYLIILLGISNILIVGYIPMLEKSQNYREFGAPVIDVLFNTLCIFFSLGYLKSYLEKKKKRFAIYYIIILIIQILLLRRSTFVWIICSSVFLLILQKKRIFVTALIAGIILIPFLSYMFGFFGDKRSGLTKEKVFDSLGTSEYFKNSGISHNHYLTYLYISSPLANLQKNISTNDEFTGNRDLKNFVFYCLLPPSFTMRLEKKLNLTEPVHKLITPELIVGTCFMLAYCSLGWSGMIIQLIFTLLYITFCLILARRWNTYYQVTVSLLTTSALLLIFDNILIRLDIIIMLFFYPIFFHQVNHWIGKKSWFMGTKV